MTTKIRFFPIVSIGIGKAFHLKAKATKHVRFRWTQAERKAYKQMLGRIKRNETP